MPLRARVEEEIPQAARAVQVTGNRNMEPNVEKWTNTAHGLYREENAMLRMTRAATMGVLIIGTVLLRLSQAMAGVTPLPGAYLSQMHGHITAIDTATNTVVIEMPREHDAFMIVGTLSPTAVVTKGGKVVPLSALHADDEVRVHWGQTAAGRQITQLAASQPSRSLQSPLEYSLRPRRSV